MLLQLIRPHLLLGWTLIILVNSWRLSKKKKKAKIISSGGLFVLLLYYAGPLFLWDKYICSGTLDSWAEKGPAVVISTQKNNRSKGVQCSCVCAMWVVSVLMTLISFCRGAGQEVGRSCIILEFKGRKIMVIIAWIYFYALSVWYLVIWNAAG